MAIKPILFNTEMVRAILEGNKTQTRRLVGGIEFYGKKWSLDREPFYDTEKNGWFYEKQTEVDNSQCYRLKPPYQVDDVLWVRETWQESEYFDYSIKNQYGYKANESDEEFAREYNVRWQSSIHMPKAAARIFLEVTGIRPERLQEITEEDAIAEGISPYMEQCYQNNGWSPSFYDPDSGGDPIFSDGFAYIWDKLYARPKLLKRKGEKICYISYPFEEPEEAETEYKDLTHYIYGNPWVWAIDFKRAEKPEGF